MEAIIARARSLKAKFGTEKCEQEDEKEDLERYCYLCTSVCLQEDKLLFSLEKNLKVLRCDGIVAHGYNPSTCRRFTLNLRSALGFIVSYPRLTGTIDANPETKEQNEKVLRL